MTNRILPYKQGSRSATALSQTLGIKQLRIEDSRWEAKAGDLVINWGSTYRDHPCFVDGILVWNQPRAIAVASNKLSAFVEMTSFPIEIPLPEYTTDKGVAAKWLASGDIVVARQKLNGHSGEGIIISSHENGIDLANAPLYTKYIKKQEEYRLHVFDDEVFFIQKKARKREVADENVNWQVRNHQNGFIYAHQDVDVPKEYKDIAINATKALGLDFGAVDMIVTKKGNPFVLEVNTACGIEGTTLEKYCEQFRKRL